MAGENEPAKLLLPYLQRADELQKHEPLVAYYCRLYAMEKGMRIPQSERTKTTNALLVSLMNQLEKDKKSLKLSPEDSLHLEGFALNVFAKADKQDRAGRADLNTAKTFYASSIFFEILNQFGPVQLDLEQKLKYAVWKAADIRKALKEGRTPNPGPPAGDEDLSVLSSTPSGEYDLGPSQNSVTSSRSESDLSSQFQDRVPPQFQDKLNDPHSANIPPSSQFDDKLNNEHSTSISPSPPYPSAGYPSHDFRPPPPPNRSESSMYSQPYHHQQYPQEPQLPHNFSSHEGPPYNYPNFQSHPSFTESSLPSVPTNYPSHYQGSDLSYSPQSAPPTTSYQPYAQATSHESSGQYSSSSKNGTISDSSQTTKQGYQYDSNYQPPPEKIAEAHKAARFAVGALAFDDVSVAVDFLQKSLELLTNPSVAHIEMIFGISCLGQSSPQRLPKEGSDEQNASVTTSVIEFIKQSLKREMPKKKKNKQYPEDKQQQQQQQLEVVSLQDWILDSPSLKEDCPNFREQVSKQFSFKIYPCLVRENPNFSYNPRESFSQERLLKDFEVDREELGECSLGRSPSETAKNRVSFQLPEESDIFIFNPDDDELEH